LFRIADSGGNVPRQTRLFRNNEFHFPRPLPSAKGLSHGKEPPGTVFLCPDGSLPLSIKLNH
ncbi:MAG: hypothetical protein J6V10_01695, partial [Clostridia bacterium]|nr:hypothetical protein [Clostridia bacterium]